MEGAAHADDRRMSGQGLAVAAALLQVAGFVVYGTQIRRRLIRPNGMSWAMRCYGALMHIYILAGLGIPTALLLQPAASAACTILVAVFALAAGRWQRPGGRDTAILTCDIVLLGLYAALAAPGQAVRGSEAVAILVLAAGRKAVPYVPALLGALRQPDAERPEAWGFWAASHAALTLAVLDAGAGSLFALYPLAATILNGAIAVAAMRGCRAAPEQGRAAARAPRPSPAEKGWSAIIRD